REDRAQRFGLLVVSALIDIGGHWPISISHRPRRMDCERDVEPVKHDATIAAAFDVEDQRHVAHPLRRPRRQRGGFRDEARKYDAATAILEIVTGKLPLYLVCHRSLLVAL